MAGFVTEDGKGGISGDAFMLQHAIDSTKQNMTDGFVSYRKRHTDVDKMKKPSGNLNRERIMNTNDYDLLTHIQQTLSLNNRCILEMITNEDHKCINTNELIQKRIRKFAESHLTEEFILIHPRSKVRVKLDDDVYDCRDETDEEWRDRLCHIYMHTYHSSKLQMFKCEECIQRWLNSNEW